MTVLSVAVSLPSFINIKCKKIYLAFFSASPALQAVMVHLQEGLQRAGSELIASQLVVLDSVGATLSSTLLRKSGSLSTYRCNSTSR